MKKYFIVIFVLIIWNVNAQNYKETFDTNVLGWTEISDGHGEAVIKDGVMHIEGQNSWGTDEWGFKQPIRIESHCYTSLDVTRNFEINLDVTVERLKEGHVGIILDYYDGGNFLAFIFNGSMAYILRFREGRLIGSIPNRIKLQDKRMETYNISIKSSYQRLQFYINNMLAVEGRYFPLTSNGFGFFVWGSLSMDFDNVEFIQ